MVARPGHRYHGFVSEGFVSEAELLDRWRDGDEEAGAQLLEQSFPRLFRFFRGKTDADVRDLIQQTLLRCVAHRDRFRGEARFSTFIFAIARTVLLEHLRARRRQFDPLQTSALDISPSLSEVASAGELRGRLREALRRIPIDLQTIVELHYWEGLTGPQLAQVLEIPEGTVRSRLRRAREALARQMESAPVDQVESWLRRTRPGDDPGP